MRIALIALALVVCATVYWLVFREPQGLSQIDPPVLVDVQGQRPDGPLSGSGEGVSSREGASGARVVQGVVQGVVRGFLVDVAGRPAAGVAYRIERQGVLTSVGVTAEDGAWALEVDLASHGEDPAGPFCVFRVNANVEMAFRLSRSAEPLRVALPELADALIVLDDHNEGEAWRVSLTPAVKRIDLGEDREVRLGGTQAELTTDRFRFTSLTGAVFRLHARAADFKLQKHEMILQLPRWVLLKKREFSPRVMVLILDESGRLEPVTGSCVLYRDRQQYEFQLRDGIANLGSWRNLEWNHDYSVFVQTSEGEYFHRAFKTPRLPTGKTQEIRLRSGRGKKSLVVSGMNGKKPFSAMFEQASGQWTGISDLEASGGDTRSYSMRPTGEVDVILMPKGWRRIFFFYRDGDIASCANTGRRTTQVRFLETSELVEQNLLSLFKELRIKGPCIVYYEVLLPGLVKSKEWWYRVDSLRLEATGLRKGKAIIWSKKLPIGMVSRLRFHLDGQLRYSGTIVRIRRK